MRTPCIYCTLKHIGQALVLWSEALQGYPLHRRLAVAHLAEASDEIMGVGRPLADRIRDLRKDLEIADLANPDKALTGRLEGLLTEVDALTAQQGKEEGLGPLWEDLEKDAPIEPIPTPSRKMGTSQEPRPPIPPSNDPNVPGCTSCQKKALARLAQEKQTPEKFDLRPWPHPSSYAPGYGGFVMRTAAGTVDGCGRGSPVRLVIMTALASFDSSYSLSGVVIDQVHAAMRVGIPVDLITMEKMSDRWAKSGVPGLVGWRCPQIGGKPILGPDGLPIFRHLPIIPQGHWKADEVDEQYANDIWARVYSHLMSLKETGYQTMVITHDLKFQAYYLTFAKVIDRLSVHPELAHVSWYHQIHSNVTEGSTERLNPEVAQLRRRIVRGRLIYPGSDPKHIERVAKEYGQDPSHVITLGNSKDWRTWGGGVPHRVACLMDRYQIHLDSNLVVFPVSSPRMEAKGLHLVLEACPKDATLLVVNAHAQGTGPTSGAAFAKELKAAAGRLDYIVAPTGQLPAERWTDASRRLIITSEVFPSISNTGMDAAEIHALLRMATSVVILGNEESFCLLAAEASLCRVPSIIVSTNLGNVLRHVEKASPIEPPPHEAGTPEAGTPEAERWLNELQMLILAGNRETTSRYGVGYSLEHLSSALVRLILRDMGLGA